MRSSSWVRQSLRRWCSASSASHSRKIVTLVSLRTWWVRDNMRGRGIGAASSSATDRSRRPNTTSISSGAGGGLELDAPPASPPVSGGGTDPPNWGLLRRCDVARHRRRCRRTPDWGMGSCWRCLGSSRGRIAGTTPSRCLLLRAKLVGGPGNRQRRCDLWSRGGGSPGKQAMG